MQQLHIDRLNETTAYMLAHPEQHNQKKWHCGTAHCWGGFGDLLEANKKGVDIKGETLNFVDAKYYGLTDQVWSSITKNTNTREQIKLFVDAAIKGKGRIINLTGVDLIGADLSDTDLSGANLISVDLTGADLSGANLINAYLIGADLSDIDLRRGDLSGASLSGANLINAYLSGANLSDVDLSDVDLTGVDLTGVDLTGAILSVPFD